jgi:hypothetical protein
MTQYDLYEQGHPSDTSGASRASNLRSTSRAGSSQSVEFRVVEASTHEQKDQTKRTHTHQHRLVLAARKRSLTLLWIDSPRI